MYKGGGWVKKDQKRAYVICTAPLGLPCVVLGKRKNYGTSFTPSFLLPMAIYRKVHLNNVPLPLLSPYWLLEEPISDSIALEMSIALINYSI